MGKQKIQAFFVGLRNRFLCSEKILSFVKIKALKLLLKLGIILGILWFFSGSWLGEKLTPFFSVFFGNIHYLFEKMLNFMQLLTQGLLILVLVMTILGKPIWRGFYVLIGLGLMIAILQRFVF